MVRSGIPGGPETVTRNQLLYMKESTRRGLAAGSFAVAAKQIAIQQVDKAAEVVRQREPRLQRIVERGLSGS